MRYSRTEGKLFTEKSRIGKSHDTVILIMKFDPVYILQFLSTLASSADATAVMATEKSLNGKSYETVTLILSPVYSSVIFWSTVYYSWCLVQC